MKFFLQLLLTVLVFPFIANAGELRIYDVRGALRSVRPIDKKASVKVEVSSQKPVSTLSLSSSSGLAPDIVVQSPHGNVFYFLEVPEGTWRIVSPEQEVTITKVEIQNSK
jgi:hypothetical protein